MNRYLSVLGSLSAAVLFSLPSAMAQESLPEDNGISTYHTSPRYRDSESHPLRILGYIFHPVGWVAREVVFRPFSYFVSSTETTKSFFGYREPHDFRQSECFSSDDSVPDCRSISPFNYEAIAGDAAATQTDVQPETISSLGSPQERYVYFPDVNFDFNNKGLTTLGKGKVHQVAQLLKNEPGMTIVLEGHTDFKGTDDFNQQLGMDRAETVKKELVALGVDEARLSTVSFGKSKPALTESEDWARAVNRRVEVKLQGGAAPAEVAQAETTTTPDGWVAAKE